LPSCYSAWRRPSWAAHRRCGGALIPFCVPFYLFHVRHAFLDLPLTLCGLLCAYFIAFARPGVASATLAGLSAGAAIMIKGMAGAACLAPALAAALIHRNDRRQLPLHFAIMLAGALLPLFIYIQALPDTYRHDFLFNLLIKETGTRVASHVSAERWLDAAGELWICLGALMPLALTGLGVLIFRARNRATITWLVLTLVAILTSLSIHAHEKTAFTRYLLPAIPFLALLAAYVAQALPRAFRPAGYLVLAAATLHTALAASPRQLINKGARFDNPGAARLAARAKELAPPGDSILVHGRPKCHAILFYGQRPVENTDHWLKTNPPTGAVHYVISWRIHAPHLPNLRTEPVATDGRWSLDRITVVAPP
jgi:4-amino-4-deoxy-L-arabinose transferase-like glycosyltransferase